MGSAPYLGGGFGHFYANAPIKIVTRTFGEPSTQLHERNDASDLATKTADKLPSGE